MPSVTSVTQAARSFDPERGIAFDRFASTRIRGALLDELRGRDWASRSVRARARGLHAAQEALTNRLGRAPSPEELATSLGVEAETVHKLELGSEVDMRPLAARANDVGVVHRWLQSVVSDITASEPKQLLDVCGNAQDQVVVAASCNYVDATAPAMPASVPVLPAQAQTPAREDAGVTVDHELQAELQARAEHERWRASASWN